LNKLSQNNNYSKNIVVEAITRSIAHITQVFDSLCVCCNKSQTKDVVDSTSFIDTSKDWKLQSEDVQTSETTPNTVFVDQDVGPMVMVSNEDRSVAEADGTKDLSLTDFLSRPVTINTFLWQVTDPIGSDISFNPWSLYMNDPAVKKKLDNYAFMRAKMHIKVLISASPFQFGMKRLCYSPLENLVGNKIRTTSGSEEVVRIPFSQQPGFDIYPQDNSGGEMELPFFYHRNWLNITSAVDVATMGVLRLVTFAQLDTAIASATNTVTIRTVAWLSDVELMGSTRSLALQADEYGNGSISKPATAISTYAGMLTDIPYIGSFARATQIGAKAVSRIATLFGYTNPPNIQNVMPIYQMSAPHLATTEISVPFQKLALDPKTELSIDPKPFGLDSHDELSINYLKKKESFFGDFLWNTTGTASTLLFNMRVSPVLRANLNISNFARRTYDTPLSYMSNMFKNWRGGLKVRMKIICTKYHKGRLLVQWDPVANIGSTIASLSEVYNHIIDIGETKDVTFEIPYHSTFAWCEVDKNATATNFTNSGNLSNSMGRYNGTLSVRIYNRLEAPVTSTIRVLVYISGADDFEFNNPTEQISIGDLGVNCPTPSFFELQSEETSRFVFGDKTTPSPNRYDMNFGEAVVSLRKLMRRTQIMDTVPLPDATVSAFNIYRKGLLRIPYSPGFLGVAWPTIANTYLAPGTSPYAFNTMHMIPYINGMFLGNRGGINYTVTVSSPIVRTDDIRCVRATTPGTVTFTNRVILKDTSVAGSASLSTKVNLLNISNLSRDGLAGLTVSSTSVSPTVQFTLPDYNRNNFAFNNPAHYVTGSSADDSISQAALITIIAPNTTGSDEVGYATIQTAAGIGSDYTCLYFICCPTLDNIINDPVAP
jgi:hypothetical protein